MRLAGRAMACLREGKEWNRTLSGKHARPAVARLCHELRRRACLADTGLTGQQDHTPTTGTCIFKGGAQDRHLLLPPDEGATNCTVGRSHRIRSPDGDQPTPRADSPFMERVAVTAITLGLG